jgi:hypothetical protein
MKKLIAKGDQRLVVSYQFTAKIIEFEKGFERVSELVYKSLDLFLN